MADAAEQRYEQVLFDDLITALRRQGVVVRAEYISKDAFISLVGVTKGTVAGWQQRHWQEGEHYQVIGHTTLIHYERVMAWLC